MCENTVHLLDPHLGRLRRCNPCPRFPARADLGICFSMLRPPSLTNGTLLMSSCSHTQLARWYGSMDTGLFPWKRTLVFTFYWLQSVICWKTTNNRQQTKQPCGSCPLKIAHDMWQNNYPRDNEEKIDFGLNVPQINVDDMSITYTDCFITRWHGHVLWLNESQFQSSVPT